jgi:hypothetical protein
MLVADFARAGRFLLWNPWTNGGSPDFADPQAGAFSPATVLTALAGGGSEWGFRLYWLAAWLLPGAGTLALARHLGAPAWGGTVAALGLLFSGFFTGHAEHTSFLQAAAWLPVIVWRLDVSIRARRLWPAVQAGAVWGLSGLAGYPGLVVLAGGFAGLWGAARWLCEPAAGGGPGPVVGRAWILGPAVGFALAGLVVLAPTYAGFFVDARGFADRVGPLPRDVAVGSNALHPGALATFASPHLPILKAYHPERLWPGTDISSAGLYVGPVVTVLALFALVARPRDPWRWCLVAFAGLSLALALGPALPLRGWLYDLYPPSRYFRHAAVFRLFAVFPAVVLALEGARDLATAAVEAGRGALRRLALPALGAAGAAALAYEAVTRGLPAAGPDRGVAAAHLWLAWGGIAAIGVVAGLLPAGPRRALLPGALVLLAAGDALLAQRLSEGTVYTRNPRWGRVWDRIASERRRALDVDWSRVERAPPELVGPGRTNRNLPVKIPVLDGYNPFDTWARLAWLEQPALVQAVTGRDRVWFAAEVAETLAAPSAFDRFVRRTAALGAPVVLLHPPAAAGAGAGVGDAGLPRIDDLPAARRVPFTVLRYQPEELALRVRCPEPGWLLVSDRWAVGWTATVNGAPAPVRRGNFIFRAVAVPAGESLVRFRYAPFGHPWLVLGSWGLLAGVAGGSAWHGMRARRGT